MEEKFDVPQSDNEAAVTRESGRSARWTWTRTRGRLRAWRQLATAREAAVTVLKASITVLEAAVMVLEAATVQKSSKVDEEQPQPDGAEAVGRVESTGGVKKKSFWSRAVDKLAIRASKTAKRTKPTIRLKDT